jgi:dTDP-4-dehydrorhamnose reductase
MSAATRILIIGANGQIGTELAACARCSTRRWT